MSVCWVMIVTITLGNETHVTGFGCYPSQGLCEDGRDALSRAPLGPSYFGRRGDWLGGCDTYENFRYRNPEADYDS